MDLLAVFQRIGRIDHDLIGNFNSSENFHRGAEVTANRDVTQTDFIVFIDDRDLRSLGAEQHGVDRDGDARNGVAGRKMYLTERTGQQLAVFVGHIDFGVEGAGGGIDGIGGANYGSGKFLAGKFLQRDDRLHADFHQRRIGLRNIDVDAQRIDAREVEELATGGSGSGVDERPWIDIAAGGGARGGRGGAVVRI